MLTLWDLLPRTTRERLGLVRPRPPIAPPRQTIIKAPPPARPRTGVERPAPAPTSGTATAARPSMQDRYDAMTREMLATHKLRVRRWRTSMSGIAWQITYRDGTVARLIESPRPKGPMSAAVFLHEVGHHAIGFHVYKPRCLEEYHAWAWSLSMMERYDLNVTDAVRRRMAQSLKYAIDKARRRGLRELPPELVPFDR